MTIVLGVVLATVISPSVNAQLPNDYGPSIGVETARKIAAAAVAEGKKNGWHVAAAVVDTAGDLVFFERMDNTQAGSTIVAQEKARTAARFKRPTKAFEDAVAGGRQVILSLPGVTPIEGGIPLVVEGKIIGAIGVSGATSPQDAQCALAGAETVGKQPVMAAPAPAAPKPPVKK
jgi:uncharacterized protein GlcG (DUF336 family)